MSSKQTSWYSNVNPNVFLSTVILIGVFLVIVILAPNSFDLITKQLNQWVTDSFGNLGLVSRSLNSEFSNNTFRVKREKFIEKMLINLSST